jgi:cyanate lyase
MAGWTGCVYPEIKAAQKERGLTNEQVAQLIGVQYARWRALLRGSALLDDEECQKACKVLRLKADQIPHIHRPVAVVPDEGFRKGPDFPL